jgi:hypothetical protein
MKNRTKKRLNAAGILGINRELVDMNRDLRNELHWKNIVLIGFAFAAIIYLIINIIAIAMN